MKVLVSSNTLPGAIILKGDFNVQTPAHLEFLAETDTIIVKYNQFKLRFYHVSHLELQSHCQQGDIRVWIRKYVTIFVKRSSA